MSRTSSQRSVEMVGNRFDLVLIAAQRTRELRRGAIPSIPTKTGHALTALQEIEDGHVGRERLDRIGWPQAKRK